MIRPFEARDFDDVLFLNGKTSYLNPCTESELEEKVGMNRAWVYEQDGSVIGSLITDEYFEHDYIWSITVAPTARNKGIGTALIREVKKHFGELFLYVSTESPAKNLYEREDFKVEKFLFNHYGRNQHAYKMIWTS